MATATITYEALFDILRRERNREELQKLQATFYAEALGYLAEKQELLTQLGSTEQYAATAEAEKARIQFHNVKKILKELYDRREKKIVTLVVNAVKTGTQLADKSTLLPEEAPLYEELTLLLRRHRREVLDAVLRQAAPFGGATLPVPQQEKDEHKPTLPRQEAKKTPAEGSKIRFLKSVPRFSGGGEEVYGPYNPGQEAKLPERIAAVLVKKGRAEEI